MNIQELNEKYQRGEPIEIVALPPLSKRTIEWFREMDKGGVWDVNGPCGRLRFLFSNHGFNLETEKFVSNENIAGVSSKIIPTPMSWNSKSWQNVVKNNTFSRKARRK